MPTELLTSGIIIFFHNMFTALWIGGLGFMAIVLLPGIRKSGLEKPQIQKTLKAIKKRFRIIVFISIAGLAITGILITERGPLAGSLFSFASTYSALLSTKHILTIMMIAGVITQTIMGKKGKSSKYLTMGNFVLGVVVVLLSSLAATFS
ncbi:MAG: hypothetical protein HN368_10295 [Spirochaetales bacterium]|jgi:uncharacterized membrane protein|nr:hypothetical protein [Spirochaetales bacterium]